MGRARPRRAPRRRRRRPSPRPADRGPVRHPRAGCAAVRSRRAGSAASRSRYSDRSRRPAGGAPAARQATRRRLHRHRGQQAVDEGRGLVRGQLLRQLDGLGDRHARRDVVVPHQLVGADAQQVPVHGRHPVERPAVRVRAQQLVDALPVALHALDQVDGVLRHRRVGRRQPVARERDRVEPRAARPRRGGRARACGPWCGRPLSVHAAEVVPGAGVDLDLGAGLEEQGHLDLVAGLDGGGLGAAGRAVALQAGLGVGDLQDHGGRQLDVERRALVHGDDGLRVLQQEVRGVPDGGVGDGASGRRCRSP